MTWTDRLGLILSLGLFQDARVRPVTFQRVGLYQFFERAFGHQLSLAAVGFYGQVAPAREHQPVPQLAGQGLVDGHLHLPADDESPHLGQGAHRRSLALLANGKKVTEQILHGLTNSLGVEVIAA